MTRSPTRPPALAWDDLRLLLDLLETGTLSAAARRAGVDQTTASRRLRRVEDRLGEALFDRADRGLRPRPLALALADDLAAMRAAVTRIAGRLADDRLRLSGKVTVSAVDLVATRLLAPAVAAFRAAHPGVRLTIEGDDRNVSLAGREADVALRLARPDAEEETRTRRLGDLPFGFYGPIGDDGTGDRPLAGYGEALAHLPESRWLATHGVGEPAFRSNRVAAIAEVVAGGHRAVLPVLVGAGDPRLVRLSGSDPIVRREVWMLVRAERRREAAVAAVVDWIVATLAPHLL